MSEPVRNMFSDISDKYDILNDILSMGRHRIWKKDFVKNLNLPSNGKHLDVATGTGDIAEKIIEEFGLETQVTGVDFSENMIKSALKRKNPDYTNLNFRVGDATNLEFHDNEFNSVSISFGIRNIPELTKAINEMSRVVKSGGILAIMEFGTPDKPFNFLYKFYSKFIIPFIGKIISGNSFAYSYLPNTIKTFPYNKEFEKILLNTGNFSNIKTKKYDFGVVYAYFCQKK
jgi:demethylmenaquinone methyltransferase/2-methoxy-6-polyprenyl-1,4-benzoquinol methylase